MTCQVGLRARKPDATHACSTGMRVLQREPPDPDSFRGVILAAHTSISLSQDDVQKA